MSEFSFTGRGDWPEWVGDVVADEYKHITPFRDASGMWRDFHTKEPLYPTMETSPLPPWVRQLKQMSDRGELPPAQPSVLMPDRRYSSRPHAPRDIPKGR